MATYITFAMHIHHVPCITYPLRTCHFIERVFSNKIFIVLHPAETLAAPTFVSMASCTEYRRQAHKSNPLTRPLHHDTPAISHRLRFALPHVSGGVTFFLFFLSFFSFTALDALQHLHLLRPGLIDHVATRKYLPLQCYMAGPASLAIPA